MATVIKKTSKILGSDSADPELQALPAGQKMLIRMGPENQRRLQAKLAEVRKQLTAAAPAR